MSTTTNHQDIVARDQDAPQSIRRIEDPQNIMAMIEAAAVEQSSAITTRKTNVLDSCLDALDIIESGLATDDQCLLALDLAAKFKEAAREVSERVNKAVLARLLPSNGELTMGPKKWYVGKEKTVKCRNVRSAVEALMQATGGDYDRFVECLSSNAFKPAATMKALGENAGECFETTYGDELKLKVSDERFQ